MVQDTDRTALETLSDEYPQLADFLDNTPGITAWVCDPGAGDCVTEERLSGVALGTARYTLPAFDLARLNATIRVANGLTDQILDVMLRDDPHRLHVRTLPIHTEAGRRVVVTARDVTVEQKLEDALKRSNDTLREMNFSRSCTTAEAVHLAFADPLTGLPNRRAFDGALADACRHGSFALCLFDMDRFKAVNDALGHAIGDRLLVEVGERLRERVRGRDFIGRLAGDEFAVILHDVHAPWAAQEAVNRILTAFNGRLDLGDVDIQASVTAGVAIGAAGDDAYVVYRNADTALHTAKGRRRGSIAINSDDPSSLAEHDDLVAVKRLLSADRLPLLFEPIVRPDLTLAGHEVTVAEESGTRTPFDTLFETANRFGLGADLATALFSNVVATAADWPDGQPLHLRLPPAIVDVDEGAALLAHHIGAAGIAPGALVVELPLAALGDGRGTRLLDELASTGVDLAVGDWDMSLSAFNLAATGRIALVKMTADAAGGMLMREGAGPVWRAAFSSLAASGVGVCIGNVGTREAAERLFALGATMARGRALAATHPLPKSMRRPRLVSAA